VKVYSGEAGDITYQGVRAAAPVWAQLLSSSGWRSPSAYLPIAVQIADIVTTGDCVQSPRPAQPRVVPIRTLSAANSRHEKWAAVRLAPSTWTDLHNETAAAFRSEPVRPKPPPPTAICEFL